MNDVVWLKLNKIPTGPGEYWDTALLEELLKDCNHHTSIGKLDQAIVIIPGAHAGKHIKKINAEINKLDHCKLVITSDEGNDFPMGSLKHPNLEIFAGYYDRKSRRKVNWLPIGPAKIVDLPYPEKDLDWFFAGQVTHTSRVKLAKLLRKLPRGRLVETDGFAKGLPQDEYYEQMARAKAVPAPRGFISADSFRFYEALELGAVPIPETPTYWPHIFPYLPMTVLASWKEVAKEINHAADNLDFRNECVAWWQRMKLDIKDNLIGNRGITTVVMPISPIKSHPSTRLIDLTIDSIRQQLPGCRIIVTFDGVRPEQQDRAEDYQKFISKFLWKYNNDNVYPLIFKEHTHQVGMAREALKYIKTPTLVYVEQDTPFTADPIDWAECQGLITDGTYDLIRFHFEAFIPDEHKHLMLGLERHNQYGTNFERTIQWSQRPHLASVAYYDRILRDHFSEDAKSFIEDKMHAVVQNAYGEHQIQGWYSHRLAIYHPKVTIQRTYHTDGRAGELKYDDTQVF